MKKMTLTLVCASALTVGLLAGCNKNEAPSAKWSEEQAEVFSEHLYGVVPPAVDGIKDITVEYVDNQDLVLALGKESTAKKLEKFSKKFKAKDGWLAQDMSDYKNVYAFEKEVRTDEGNRFVYTIFYAVNRDGDYVKSGNGKFQMLAYDPYYYEWPSLLTADFADYYESEVVPPAIEADYYFVDTDYFEIQAYYEYTGDDDDGGYSEILAAYYWNIREDLDADGYYVANCPDGNYSVRYLYLEKYGCLDIWFDVAIFDSLPTTQINRIFTKYAVYGAVPFEFPAPTGESISFSISEGWNAFYIAFDMFEYVSLYVTVYDLTDEEYEAYLEALESTYGWTVNEGDENSSYTATKTQNDYINKIDLSYDDGQLDICVYLISDHAPYESWPPEAVAALFPTFISDVVPAYSGDNLGIKVNRSGVVVMLDPEAEQTPEEALAAYALVLTTALYTPVLDNNEKVIGYDSPNSQFRIKLSVVSEGLSISFSLLPYKNDSPDYLINCWLQENGFNSGIFPSVSITGASWSISSYNSSMLSIRATGTSEQINAALTAFVAALDESFEVTFEWGEADKEYTSETYGISVNPYISGSDFVLRIYPADED